MKLVPASVSATVARLIGVNDKPMVGPIAAGPQRFSGPGWYAFRHPGMWVTVVFWSEAEDEEFIRLSGARDGEARASLSHEEFDRSCVGRVFSAAEVEQRRHEREARA